MNGDAVCRFGDHINFAKNEQLSIWHATLDKVFAQEIQVHAVRGALPQIRSVID